MHDLEPIVAEEAPKVTLPIAVQEAKPKHKSLTVILNTIVTVLGLLVVLQPTEVASIVSALVVDEELAVALSGAIVSAIALANVLIRIYKTKQPIAD